MQSILILGKDKEKLREKASLICDENNISKFDKTLIESEKITGIEEIRNLQKKIFLKPAFSQSKAVILESFFGITSDAQNAFLKVLEEPPNNTIILILIHSLDHVLPTILSRCNLINLESKREVTKEDMEKFSEILTQLKKQNISYALKIAQNNSKDKEKALLFLENLIVFSNSTLNNLQKDFTFNEFKNILINLQKTYTTIKSTNISPRFALENLFLNILN